MSEKLKIGMGFELGDVGTRFIAIAIDSIILGFVIGLFTGFADHVGTGVGLLFTILYNWYFWTRQDGQTPGKKAMGLRVVKRDGTAISDVDAAIRAVGYYVSGFVMGIGYIWAMFDDEKRTWHDMLSGTIVISTK